MADPYKRYVSADAARLAEELSADAYAELGIAVANGEAAPAGLLRYFHPQNVFSVLMFYTRDNDARNRFTTWRIKNGRAEKCVYVSAGQEIYEYAPWCSIPLTFIRDFDLSPDSAMFVLAQEIIYQQAMEILRDEQRTM